MTKVNLFKREANNLEGKAVDTADHTLYYETAQNSEVVEKTFILVHGACSSGRHMALLADELLKQVDNAKVVVLDLPFHGYSIASVGVEGLTVHDYKKYTLEFVQALQEKGELEGITHWIGWSMGGSLGLLLNIEDGLFDELTLVNSAPYWANVDGILPLFENVETAKEVFKSVVSSEMADVEESVVADFIAEYNENTPSGAVVKNDLNAITPQHYDVRDKLDKVTAKTLIYSGLKDNLAETGLQELMGERIANSKVVLVDDTHATVLKPNRAKEIVEHIKNN